MPRPCRSQCRPAYRQFCRNEAGSFGLVSVGSELRLLLSMRYRRVILFGAACVFYFVAMRHPAPAVDQKPEGAHPKAPAAARPPQSSVTPPTSPTPPAVAPIYPTPKGPAAATPAPPGLSPSRPLMIPIAGIDASQLSDTFNEIRGGRWPHEAIDIVAPRGTPVVAVDDGKVVKLFNKRNDQIVVVQLLLSSGRPHC